MEWKVNKVNDHSIYGLKKKTKNKTKKPKNSLPLIYRLYVFSNNYNFHHVTLLLKILKISDFPNLI